MQQVACTTCKDPDFEAVEVHLVAQDTNGIMKQWPVLIRLAIFGVGTVFPAFKSVVRLLRVQFRQHWHFYMSRFSRSSLTS